MAKKSARPAEGLFERSLRSIKVDKSTQHAEVLLLTCIDFKYFDLIAQKMCEEKLTGKYDHFVLAGAALGATLDFNNAHLPGPAPPDCECRPFLPRLHWQQVFLEHLELALSLHKTIHRVIIVEHRECGAYKAFLKPEGYPPPTAKADPERVAHKKHADKLEAIIHGHFTGLTVEKWLARLRPDQIGPLLMTGPNAFEALEIEDLN